MQDQTGIKRPCGTVQRSINEFLGKKRPLPSQSSKHLEPATDQQETKKHKCMSRQTNKKRKTRKSRLKKKLGPSKFNRCSSQKEEMKEKRADVSRKTDETTSKTTPASHEVKDEMKENIIISFQNIFNNIRMNDIHSYYICCERYCTEICKED